MERTLFVLDWLQDPGLRRKVTAGLNKVEARNTLARAVFFNRLGEIRDRSFEQQHYRSSGLNLLTAAIVLWNTVYPDRTVATLSSNGGDIDPDLLRFLSPLGWEHINPTGDYTWPRASHIKPGKYRPLRRRQDPGVGYCTFSQACESWCGWSVTGWQGWQWSLALVVTHHKPDGLPRRSRTVGPLKMGVYRK